MVGEVIRTRKARKSEKKKSNSNSEREIIAQLRKCKNMIRKAKVRNEKKIAREAKINNKAFFKHRRNERSV